MADANLDIRIDLQDNASRGLGSIGQGIRGIGSAVRGLAVPAVAAGTAIAGVAAALFAVGDTVTEEADRLAKLEAITGVPAELLQAFELAFEEFDLSDAQLTQLFRRITVRIGDTYRDAIEDLGINYDEYLDADVVTRYDLLAEAVQKLGNNSFTTYLASRLLGPILGPQLVPLLLEGEEGIDAYGEKVEGLGLLIDDETIALAEKYQEAKGDIELAFEGLKRQIAFSVIPVLTSAALTFLSTVRTKVIPGINLLFVTAKNIFNSTQDIFSDLDFSGDLGDTFQIIWQRFLIKIGTDPTISLGEFFVDLVKIGAKRLIGVDVFEGTNFAEDFSGSLGMVWQRALILLGEDPTLSFQEAVTGWITSGLNKLLADTSAIADDLNEVLSDALEKAADEPFEQSAANKVTQEFRGSFRQFFADALVGIGGVISSQVSEDLQTGESLEDLRNAGTLLGKTAKDSIEVGMFGAFPLQTLFNDALNLLVSTGFPLLREELGGFATETSTALGGIIQGIFNGIVTAMEFTINLIVDGINYLIRGANAVGSLIPGFKPIGELQKISLAGQQRGQSFQQTSFGLLATGGVGQRGAGAQAINVYIQGFVGDSSQVVEEINEAFYNGLINPYRGGGAGAPGATTGN